jgi:molecular chaperone GrpE
MKTTQKINNTLENQKDGEEVVADPSAAEYSPEPLQPEEQRVAELREQLQQATESERRALADYKNLLRRTQEERGKMIKLAAASVITSILQPLDHLALAAAQLKDPGLNMICSQFQRALADEGVEIIDCLGKPFNHETMEVIDTQPAEQGQMPGTVMKIAQNGYVLNGEILQHAKVVVAADTKQSKTAQHH